MGSLSFAPGSETIDLAPLNVVISPNGSGKWKLDRRRPGCHGTLLRTGLPSEKPTPAVKPRGRAQGQLVLQARERDEGHEQGGVLRVQQRKDPACQQQFPARDFRPQNTLVLISHFANSLRIMLSRIPYLTTWANGVARHGTCSR